MQDKIRISIHPIAFGILFILFPIFCHAQQNDKKNKPVYFLEKYHARLVGNFIYSPDGSSLALDGEFSGLRPLTFINYINAKGKKKKKLNFDTYGYSFLQVGYEYNMQTKVNSLRLGVFQLVSPFSINPIQFIHQGGENTRGWIYRPEAGFGFWIFQFNYGFNIFLKSELRTQSRHNIIFKIHFPF